MASVDLYLDLRRGKKDGTYPLKIKVRHQGNILVSTGIDVNVLDWDGRKIKNGDDRYKIKNAKLDGIMAKVEKYILSLEMSDEIQKMSDGKLRECLREVISDKPKKVKVFADYLEEFADTKTKKSTKECYIGTLQKIREYDPQCTFEDMNRKWLDMFNKEMVESGLKTNTRGIHFRNIRAVFNYAIDNGYTSSYPFRKFRIEKEQTRKRSLDVRELVALRDFPCEMRQEKYRDIFMLMFYLIGINAVDLFGCKSLEGGRIEYKRAKTGRLYSIKVEPEAMEIIRKYRGKGHLLCVLDDYKNYKDFLHRMNENLRNIGPFKRSGRGGKLTRYPLFPEISSYWSRHTWATIAASLDIPKETISAALGHEIGSSVTSIYIDFDRRKVDEANRMVIDYVNGIGKTEDDV